MKKILPRAPIDCRYILAGLFFFINPDVSSLDVLPDFIGAALIIAGFLHLAEINERCKAAQKALTILSFVSAGRMLTLLLHADFAGSAWPLIFTFTFGIGEAILFSYAMIMLYDGVVYEAMRRDCPAIYTGFTAFKGLTVLVAALKSVLCFLPELTGLTSEYGTVDSVAGNRQQIASFTHTALLVLNIAVVTLYGIGWWIYMLRFFRTIHREPQFSLRAEEVYETEVKNKPGVLTYRALRGSALLFGAGLFFLIPIRLDGIDFLPDFAAGILLILAVLRLKTALGKSTAPTLIAGGVYTLFASVEWIYKLVFYSGISVPDETGFYGAAPTYLLTHPEKLPYYYLLTGVSVAKYLALALFVFMICRLFAPVITEHTGSPYELSEKSGKEKTRLIRRRLEGFRLVLTVFGLLAALSGVFYSAVRMFSDLVAVEYSEIFFTALFFILFLVFLNRLGEGIDNKYYMAKE